MHANETVIEGQKRALELVMRGASLNEVLDEIARTVERQSENAVLASILLLDEEGKHLLHGGAPSLADEYCKAIHGIDIGPTVGSCGTAAHFGKTVVVEDIATDPLWKDFKGLAMAHGMRACWSTPIFNAEGRILGTFALYHRVPMVPSERDRHIVELMSRTAALVIERDLQARRLRANQTALETFIDNLPELAWTARADGHIDFFNRRWVEYTGLSLEQGQGSGWEQLHDPALLPLVKEKWQHSLATGEPFEMEYTLRGADGVSRWFLSRVVPSRDMNGKIVRWFGTSTNIHDMKMAQALTEAVAEQSRETERLVLELRAAKERAEQRVRELEAR